MIATRRSRATEALIAVATITPVFVVVALLSTLEKALLAATAVALHWLLGHRNKRVRLGALSYTLPT